jgi:two-component system, OmpR family, sensor histidine kinase KdpD
MYHSSDIITLFVMFIVAQVISHLTIHVRRNAEEAKVAQMQTETERFRNLLLSSISHDLRTPLASIMGAASLFLTPDDKLDACMRKELAQDIYNESDRLNRLVNNILQLVKLESQSFQINKQLNALEEVVGSVLNSLEKTLQGRQTIINIPPLLPLLYFDSILIEKVLHNIIENAVKFSPPASPIQINVEICPGHVLVHISDEGQGIKEEDLHKVFLKFYQGKRCINNGIGLGLAICKDIIKAHGGNIWASNKKGGGAVFSFTLPLTD